MKFLRLLTLLACLNVPFTYAMESKSLVSTLLVPVAKVTVAAAGAGVMVDGYLTILGKKTIVLPAVPPVSDREGINGACRVTVGVGEFYAGWFLALNALLR